MRKSVKSSMAILLSLVLVLSTFFAVDMGIVNAAATTKAGDKATYDFNATTGTLTISGTGRMYDFRATNLLGTKAPWQDNKPKIKKVVVEKGITYIGQYSFYNCVALTEVSLPSTLREIGGMGDMTTSYGAFQNCTALTSIVIPEGVTLIDNCAFKDCTALATVTLPSTLQTIDYGAFCRCSALTSMTFPDSLTSIAQNAFRDCTALTTVTFGNGMQSTGVYSFYQSGIRYINFSPSIKKIDTYSFYGCAMSTLDIPATVETINIRAFGDTYFFHSVTINNPDTEFKGIVGEDPFNAGDRPVTLTIYGHSGSTAETYAAEKNYNFVSIDGCDHESTYERITKQPTCTEQGSKDIICSTCQQRVRTLPVDVTDHDYYVTASDDKTEINGHITNEYTCRNCGDVVVKVEHQLIPEEESEETPPTGEGETEEGEGEGPSIGETIGGIIGSVGDVASGVIKHYIWIDGYYTYTNTATCTRPGIEKYTCTVEGCEVTESKAVASKKHEVSSWTTTTAPTCTTAGEHTGVCSVCNETVTEAIDPIGHTLSETLKDEYDHTIVDGHTYKVYECTACGEDVAVPTHVEWVETYYTPNVITPARCTVNGLEIDTCDVCGERRNVVLEAIGEHAWYVTNVNEPTCTSIGKTFYACSNPGCNSTKSENVEALGHDYQIVEESCKEPTCLSAGYDFMKCSRCTATKQDAKPALGHTPDESTYVVNTPATCTADGYATAHCTTCGEDYSAVIKAYGHDYVDVEKPMINHPGHSYITPTCSRCRATLSSSTKHTEWLEGYYTTEVATEAACLVQGRTRYVCTYCDETKTEVTSPALGHHYIATGTITSNYNISYVCEFCHTPTLQNPHTVLEMWNNDYLFMTSTNRTAVDNTCLIDANGDGYINARDYALLKNLAKVAPLPTQPEIPELPQRPENPDNPDENENTVPSLSDLLGK